MFHPATLMTTVASLLHCRRDFATIQSLLDSLHAKRQSGINRLAAMFLLLEPWRKIWSVHTAFFSGARDEVMLIKNPSRVSSRKSQRPSNVHSLGKNRGCPSK